MTAVAGPLAAETAQEIPRGPEGLRSRGPKSGTTVRGSLRVPSRSPTSRLGTRPRPPRMSSRMAKATIGPLLGLVEPPLRSQGLCLGSWSSRCVAESCACAPGAAVALSVRVQLLAISSTAILRWLQGRDADGGRDGRRAAGAADAADRIACARKFAATIGPMAAAQRARCGSRPCRPRALVAAMRFVSP